jgi:hypothetical protein
VIVLCCDGHARDDHADDSKNSGSSVHGSIPITRLPDYPITRLPNYPITRLLNYPV